MNSFNNFNLDTEILKSLDILNYKIPSQNLPDNLPCSDYADTIGFQISLHCHAFSNGIPFRFSSVVLPVRSEKKQDWSGWLL